MKKSSKISSFADFEKFLDDFCSKYSDLVDSYRDNNNIDIKKIAPAIYDVLTKSSIRSWDNAIIKAINRSVYYDTNIIDELEKIDSSEIVSDKTNLQRYFEDVGNIYDKNDNNFDIEYCPENRDKLISMNLKNVITIAKRFRGNGLSLDELISAGNEGLCVAFEKYNPNRQKLRSKLIDTIEEMSSDEVVEYERVHEMFSPLLSYGKVVEAFKGHFKKGCTYHKDELLRWVSKNIKPARFNSVAVMWITAYIMIELDNVSRLIKKPKKDIRKEKTGESKKEVYMNLSSPMFQDDDRTLEDTLVMQDDTIGDFEVDEAHTVLRDTIQLLLTGVKLRNKRIIMQRFGIGLPRPMSPKEISEREGISIARVSQIVQLTIDEMKKNYNKYKDRIDPDVLYDFIDRCENYM